MLHKTYPYGNLSDNANKYLCFHSQFEGKKITCKTGLIFRGVLVGLFDGRINGKINKESQIMKQRYNGFGSLLKYAKNARQIYF